MKPREVRRDAALMLKGMRNLGSVVRSMGYEDLREGQRGPVASVLSGSDTMAIMPTSAGKSLIYAAATKALEWHTLVLSPLRALMRDQVQNFNTKGVRAASYNSSNTKVQNDGALQDWSEGALDLLYMAPEALDSDRVKLLLKRARPDMIVVDEAHCIARYGGSFRPKYRSCGAFISELDPRVILAVTATATDEVVEDIQAVLGIQGSTLFWDYTPRTELKLSSSRVRGDDDLLHALKSLIDDIDGSVIIYADTRKHVEAIYTKLRNIVQGEMVFYHAGMDDAALNMAQDRFMTGTARVIVATNAFGMGVDKPDIRGIIHAYPPGSLESVAQETGRASRDGKPAVCHMFYSYGMSTQEFLTGTSHPSARAVRAVYNALLQRMDNNNYVRMSAAKIAESLPLKPDQGAGSVVGFLEAEGIVTREKLSDGVYIVVITDPSPSGNSDVDRMITAIRSVGAVRPNTKDGFEVRAVSPRQLMATMGIAESTLKVKMAALGRSRHASVEAPFTGNAIKVLKNLEPEVCEKAEIKRQGELAKVQMVMQYCQAPDGEKHQFLANYFELQRTSARKGNDNGR